MPHFEYRPVGSSRRRGASGRPADVPLCGRGAGHRCIVRRTHGQNYVDGVLGLDEPPRYRESNTARTLADNLIDRWEWTDSPYTMVSGAQAK